MVGVEEEEEAEDEDDVEPAALFEAVVSVSERLSSSASNDSS